MNAGCCGGGGGGGGIWSWFEGPLGVSRLLARDGSFWSLLVRLSFEPFPLVLVMVLEPPPAAVAEFAALWVRWALSLGLQTFEPLCSSTVPSSRRLSRAELLRCGPVGMCAAVVSYGISLVLCELWRGDK